MKPRMRAALLILNLCLAVFIPTASAQERAKEPTDGFFDVPARAPGEESEPWGLPAYMVTSAIGGMGIFVLCRSARRS